MKIKRILAAILSLLMLGSMMVFTASADDNVVYVMRALNGNGFSGEAVTRTKAYDAENDIIYYNFVPANKDDWMHLGWHGAAGAFEWATPMTVGVLVRTNHEGGIPSIRLCDRSDTNNKLTINKKAAALKGDESWETVWFPEVTAEDVANVSNENATFDGLTHVQLFAIGENLVGQKQLESGIYFDVAGYVFFNDTAGNLASVDLAEVIGVGAPIITISFDAQNGTDVSSYTAKSGEYVSASVNFPEAPEAPDGKVFAGWSASADGSSGIITEANVPGTDTTYYAIWAQDDSEPGDVTLTGLTINGTKAEIFGLTSYDSETLTVKVPYNWSGDKVPTLVATATDPTATVTITAGTFGEGSAIKVKNGSSVATYNVVYNNAEEGSKTAYPGGVVTSNSNGVTAPYNGENYLITGTRFASSTRSQKNAEIAGATGTKLEYNKLVETVPASGAVIDTEAKTITGNASYYTIATDSSPAYEGGGAFNFVTLSDYPWMRVKYYIDPGEDGQSYARPFAVSTTSWNNGAASKGYAESTKKNTQVFSADNMVVGRWAYVYLNLDAFAEDYGYTYQFHFRPYEGAKFRANAVSQVSADNANVAVPKEGSETAVLFDDAFYIADVSIFNEFPGTEGGLFEQIAPYEGLFTTTGETEIGANDGTISGLTTDMEYRLKGTEEWTAYTESALQSAFTLPTGTYEIRYAEYEGAGIDYAASPVTEVTISSALALCPHIRGYAASAVGENDGKICDVDDTMSYRIKGDTEWTPVADGVTELTGMAPGVYEFIYLADGELRTEDSEISTVEVVIDFDVDYIMYVTNDADHADRTLYDGSCIDMAFYIGTGDHVKAALTKCLEKDASTALVVVDGINLGGWKENIGGGEGCELLVTGLYPESYIDFCCHNGDDTFAMQNFGNLKTLTVDNITLRKTCLAGNSTLSGEAGFTISAGTQFTIGENVISGANSDRIRVYTNANNTLTNSYTINGGTIEGLYAGPTFDTDKAVSGSNTITVNGGSVAVIQATRHCSAFAGDFDVYVNGGTVRDNLIAGSRDGAFAGDAYVEINGGNVKFLRTTAQAAKSAFNITGGKEYTDNGIKNGSSVVIINGGAVEQIQVGSVAPGGSALIIGEEADVPELTGAEADYVIGVYGDASAVIPVLDEKQYTYQPVRIKLMDGDAEETITNNGDPVTYTASTITGFEIDIPEGYNMVKVNGEAVELADGVLALDALSKDEVNVISFSKSVNVKLDLNGGNVYLDDTVPEASKAMLDEEGLDLELGDSVLQIPNPTDVFNFYYSGHKLLGFATAPEATADELITFPWNLVDDVAFYAIWEEANSTSFEGVEIDGEEELYFTYTDILDDEYTPAFPDIPENFGNVNLVEAAAVVLRDASLPSDNNGNIDEDTEFDVTFDASDYGDDIVVLFADEDGNVIQPVALGGGMYSVTTTSGIINVFVVEPNATYSIEGTYYSKRNEYVVDIYLDSVAVNAGSIGLSYDSMTYNGAAFGESVQNIETLDGTDLGVDSAILFTWGVADGTAYIGGNDEKVHIATINFTMTPEQREAFVENGYKLTQFDALEDIHEVYEDGYYLVAAHYANSLAVEYAPAYIGSVTDNVGPDDMVTVKGTVEMTAREDGDAPADGNYAVLYWKHAGSTAFTKVVIEDADTDTAVVEYTLNDVPADVDIEIFVEKNGYLKGTLVTSFEAKTDDETDEQPIRTADAIELVAGDIKSDFNDACGDGKINIADFVRVLRGFEEAATEEYKNVVDVNEDGSVNVTDLGYVKANFGMEAAE